MEYALLCTVIILVAGFGVTSLSGAMSNMIDHQSDQVTAVVTPSP